MMEPNFILTRLYSAKSGFCDPIIICLDKIIWARAVSPAIRSDKLCTEVMLEGDTEPRTIEMAWERFAVMGTQ